MRFFIVSDESLVVYLGKPGFREKVILDWNSLKSADLVEQRYSHVAWSSPWHWKGACGSFERTALSLKFHDQMEKRLVKRLIKLNKRFLVDGHIDLDREGNRLVNGDIDIDRESNRLIIRTEPKGGFHPLIVEIIKHIRQSE
jgi:hypothetical protein